MKVIKRNFAKDYDELIEEHGMEYLQENDADAVPYYMDDINEILSDAKEALEKAFHGYRYNPYNDDHKETFVPFDEYFAFNGYNNLVSIREDDLDEYIKDQFLKEEFVEWCKKQGYVDEEEDFACGEKGKKKFSDDAIFMFPETGAIGTYDEWWYDEIDEDGNYTGKQLNAVDHGEVVEVIKDENGNWVEKEFACGGKKRVNNSQKPIIRKNASKKNFGYSDWRFQAKVDEWNEKEHSYDETVAHFGWDFLEGYCERSNNYDKMPESMDQFIQFLEDNDYDDDTMARLADSFDKEDDYVYVNKDGKYDSLKEKELDEYFVDVIPASGFNGFERWAKACGINLDA